MDGLHPKAGFHLNQARTERKKKKECRKNLPYRKVKEKSKELLTSANSKMLRFRCYYSRPPKRGRPHGTRGKGEKGSGTWVGKVKVRDGWQFH